MSDLCYERRGEVVCHRAKDHPGPHSWQAAEVLLRSIDEQLADSALRSALAEIRELHQPIWTSPAAKEQGKEPWVCGLCGTADGSWPCGTRIIADEAL